MWLGDGSCVRLRAEHKNHVLSYDFVEARLSNGRRIRFLNTIDEYDRTLIACVPRHSWRDNSVVDVLHEAFMAHGTPDYIRSDNGSEFIANKVRNYLSSAGVATLYIEPGSPWENGYCESFNSKMRDEFLNREVFETFYEVEVLTKEWMRYYNYERPHKFAWLQASGNPDGCSIGANIEVGTENGGRAVSVGNKEKLLNSKGTHFFEGNLFHYYK